MCHKGAKTIADFEWASVGQYMRWVACYLELGEISAIRVSSFPLQRYGSEKLIGIKRKERSVCLANLEKLESYVRGREFAEGEGELVALRSMYLSYKRSADLCTEHIDRVRRLDLGEEQLTFMDELDWRAGDEILF